MAMPARCGGHSSLGFLVGILEFPTGGPKISGANGGLGRNLLLK